MNSYLRQSTASQSRAIGPFLDDTDFKTPEIALTIANTDIKLCANGAASANKNSGGGTHRVNGIYGVTFDAIDTATVGELFVSVVVAGALPVFHTFTVVEELVYDALYVAAAGGFLQPTVAGRTLDVSAGGEAGLDWANIGTPGSVANLTNTLVGNVNSVSNVAAVGINAINALSIATGAIDADAMAAGAVNSNSMADGTITSTKFVGGAIGAATLSTGTIDSTKFAAGAITAAAIATNAIDADSLATDAEAEIQAGLATAASIAALNNVSTAQVQASATAALNAYDPPTYAEMQAGFAAGDDAVLSAIAALPTAATNASTLLSTVIGTSGVGTLDERTVRSALRLQRNRWAINAGVLTVYKEDDGTVAWTAAVSESGGNPVNQVDPT